MYGVGAGYPYRISEYLDELEPNIEHVNISEVGSSFINYNDQENLREKLILGKIDKIIYIMNLNDIAPLANYDLKNNLSENNSDNSKISTILRNRILKKLDESLRGKSFFYTHLRLKFKNFLMVKLNLNSTGFKAIELFPNEHENDIKLAAKNLSSLINKGIFEMPICVIILPYEMQISKHATKKYKNMGLNFEKDFLNFKTQKIFINEFKKNTNNIFYLGESFEEKNVGEYFVYNKGDKIDFNHPNKFGYKVLAEEIYEKRFCI